MFSSIAIGLMALLLVGSVTHIVKLKARMHIRIKVTKNTEKAA